MGRSDEYSGMGIFWSWYIGLALGILGLGTGIIFGQAGSMYTYMYLLSPFL